MTDPRGAIRRALWTAGATLLVIGLASVAASRTDVGRATLDDLLARARPAYLAAAIGLMASTLWASSMRWRALLPGRPAALGLTAAACTGQLLTLTVPGPVGEVVATWLVNRRYGVPFGPTLAAGIASRLVGMTVAAAIAVTTLLAFDLPVPEALRPAVRLAGLLMAAVAVGLGWLAARPAWWKALVARVTAPFDGSVGWLTTRVRAVVGATADALAVVATAGPAAWAEAVGWGLAGYAVASVGSWLVLVGLDVPAPLPAVAFALTGAVAATIVAFALPGAHLAFDGLFLAFLVGAAGVALADAVAVTAAMRLTQVCTMIAGALVMAWLPVPPEDGYPTSPEQVG